MAFSDPIAEFLTIIRNGGIAAHRYVDVRHSRLRKHIAELLKNKGFIDNFIIDDSSKRMRLFLKYNSKRKHIIRGLKRFSRPGCRKYTGYYQIPVIFGGMGVVIMSTPKGIMDGEEARGLRMGGEILGFIW